MLNEPLGLPKGSVRAILTLGIVVADLVALLTGNKEAVVVLTPIMSMIVGHYFGNRSEFTRGDGNGRG